MSQEVIAPPKWKDWLPVLAIMLSVAGSMLVGGGYISQVKDNTRRIDEIERKADARDDKLNIIDTRTARIEAKLEVLIPEQKRSQTQ